MANTITSVIAEMFNQGLVGVPREKIGALNAVSLSAEATQASTFDTVSVPVSPAMAATPVTPSQTFTVGADRDIGKRSLTLDVFEEVTWNQTAEEERALENSGNAQDIMMQSIAQGIRTLANKVEASIINKAYVQATRAFGTAGTAPFATDLKQLAAIVGILDENGVGGDRHAVLSTQAKVNMLGLTQLSNANQAGSDALLRQGAMADLFDVMIHNSAQVPVHVKGTATGALVNASGGLAVGATNIPFDGATAGATGIKAGDVITFAADSDNKYVVVTGVDAASGTLVIQGPGLRKAIPDNNAITVGNDYSPNLVLSKSAVVAAIRPGLQPVGALAEQSVVTDPVSGISALLLRVPGNALSSYYLRIVYGSFAPNPYAIATLLG